MKTRLLRNNSVLPGPFHICHGIALAVVASMFLPLAYAAPANQPEDPIFAGADEFAHGATKTTEVNLGPDTLQMANGMSKGKMMKKLPPMVKNVKYVYVREFEYAKPGQYKMADLQKFVKRLQGNGWTQMVKEVSSDKITEVCVRKDDDGESREMVVIDAEPTKLDLVHLRGLASTDEISKTGSPPTEPQLKNRTRK